MTLTTYEELKHLASSDNTNELTRRLARECMANREAQPVAWLAIYHGEVYDEAISITRSVVEAQAERFGWESALTEIIPLYRHAPPAPAVPDNLAAAVNRLLDCDGTRGHFSAIRCSDAREEVERLLAQPVSSGYKLVPAEPTEDMIAAAMNCDDVSFNADETFCVNFGNIYAAMLAAAPEDGNG